MGSYRPGRVSVAAAAGGMACVVAVLAGCSSSSSKTTTSTAAGSLSSSASSTAAASPSASPASAAQLAKIVLQPTDFPTGWDHTPYKPDPSDSAAYAEFAKCLGAPNTDQVAEAHSDDFALGGARISSAAYSFRSQSTVDAYTAGLLSAKASPCFEPLGRQMLASAAPPGSTIESVSFRIGPGSVGGLPNIVATAVGNFKIKAGGKSGEGNLTVAFINGPLIEANVPAFSTGAPVPTSLMGSLAAAVAGRAAQP